MGNLGSPDLHRALTVQPVGGAAGGRRRAQGELPRGDGKGQVQADPAQAAGQSAE